MDSEDKKSGGYGCEFMDSVPEDFYCKACSLVARRLTFTSCCGESYCHDCISSHQEQDPNACPSCESKIFNIFEQIKYQKRMGSLQVYCSMKERGCGWSGTLEQLDTHLDPHQNNCQYVDTKCPLNCEKVLPKIELQGHLSESCAKRDFTCQFCAFKATYEEVVDIHLAECRYFPLRCPNVCGVTCEREVMEDHLKICRLQVVECAFAGMGCDEKFKREKEEEHAAANVQQHLSLIAISGKKQILLLEKLEEQETKLEEQEKKLEKQNKVIVEQCEKIQAQGLKLQELELKLKLSPVVQSSGNVLGTMPSGNFKEEMKSMVDPLKEFILRRCFFIKNFSKEKEKDRTGEWKSPIMYTHLHGYKFCIGIDANGHGVSQGKAIVLELWPLKGEYDFQLSWPAVISITIHLISQVGGANWHSTDIVSWSQPEEGDSDFYNLGNVKLRSAHVFVYHNKLNSYLSDDDTLFFRIRDITVHDN